ncbi:MAG: CPBP family glutamic-type intramembrane protease, partial [Cytophagales bacterium]
NGSQARYGLLIFQALSTGIGGFIVPVLVWLFFVESKSKNEVFDTKFTSFNPLIALAVFAFVLVFMPFNSILIHLNSMLDLPDSFSSLEKSMKDLESSAENTTSFLTDFEDFNQFLFGFFVISLLTGFGEEFFFRRGIQKKLQDSGYNIHFSIWITATVFSFVHFQFYGFLPRLVLGALFGYIYFWTQNLTYPILAHITNNGFTLALIHVQKLSGDPVDFSDKEMAPWYWVLLSLIGSFALAFLIKKSGMNPKKNNDETRNQD